jgi:hypothetical protein
MTWKVTADGRRATNAIAPAWHTAAFAAVFLLLALAGALFQAGAPAHPERLQQHPQVATLYLSLIAVEWTLVFWVARGMRRSGTRLRDVIGGRWSNATAVAADALLALGVWTVWTAGQVAWDRWLGPGHAASVGALLPRGPVEAVLWIALSMSAGFCEEVAFRGYLQAQFHALTGSRWAAILLQAAIFGVAHGYQGIGATMRIAAYAVVLGLVAWWRRSLRPGMLAHAWSDIFAGLVAR